MTKRRDRLQPQLERRLAGHSRLQCPFGRWNRIGLTRVNLYRHAQCAGQRLVTTFNDMVIVTAIKIFDMQRDPRRCRETVEPMFDQLGIPFAQPLHVETGFPDKIWPPRNIKRAAGKSFIHRRISAAIAGDPALVAQRRQHRFADRNTGVFGGVVLINMQIAYRLYFQVDQRVPRQLFKHVIQKSDACRNFVNAGAVQINLYINRRFIGFTADCTFSHARRYTQMDDFGKYLKMPITVLISPPSQSTNKFMSEDTPESLIPYDDIVQEALRAVVGRVLRTIAVGGLPGDHHFYITFKTQAPGVAIPSHLHERFPDEMTIVLQHKYWDLKIEDEHFEVGLSFSQIPSHLVIPYSAITAFVDPLVDFALQFHVDASSDGPEPHEAAGNDEPSIAVEDGSNVVSVDFGRKK
jgi:hypothetical protein